MVLQLTNFAVGVLATNPSPILETFKIGSAFNYVPLPADTDIHGSTLFTGTISPPQVLNANVVRYTVAMDTSVGDFDWGEVGFFYQGQLFALAVGNSLQQKQKVGISSGNQVRLDAFLTVVGTNYNMIVDQADSSNLFQMANLSTLDQIPPSNQASPNVYIISAASSSQSSFIAYTDRNGLWNFDAYQFATGVPATVVSADLLSVTIAMADYVPSMTPQFFGQVALEFTTGNLYSICRYVKTAIQSGSNMTLGFQTPMAIVPSAGDKIMVFTRVPGSADFPLPIASANVLGGIKIGIGLVVQLDGTCSVDPSSLGAVTSVNGKGPGVVTLTADDIPGLAAVAKSGSYNDLTDKPTPYSLPIASTVVLGGVKAPTSGNLTINGQGVIDLGFTAVKTVNGVVPDLSGNVNVVDTDIGLINPESVTSGANINSYNTTGLFTVTAAVAGTVSNAPSNTEAATLEVVPLVNGGTGDVIQRWSTPTGMWWRARYTAVWTAWNQVATLAVATTTTLGVVKIGAGLTVDGNGLLSAPTLANKLDQVNGVATGLFFAGNALPSATTTISADVATANFQTVTVTGTGTVTWSLTGWPASGTYGEMEFQITNGGLASSHVFPAAVQWVKPDGTMTTDFPTYMTAKRGTANFQNPGVDFVIFWSSNNGATIYARVM